MACVWHIDEEYVARTDAHDDAAHAALGPAFFPTPVKDQEWFENGVSYYD